MVNEDEYDEGQGALQIDESRNDEDVNMQENTPSLLGNVQHSNGEDKK